MRSIARNISESLPARPESVGHARRMLADFAAAAGASERKIEDIRLASSEALTNAILHAYREEEGCLHVTAALVSNDLWVLIADDGCGMEPQAQRPGLGLGLGLISQLSDHLTIAPRSGGGTEVRMRFTLVGAGCPGDNHAHRSRARRHDVQMASPRGFGPRH
jgi:serine/threonine-protein kinase RsbW/stage II sporulation protein AB (anti-sigma F factor)